VAHILTVNCDEMAGDSQIGQNNLRVKFLALNVDFRCLSPDRLGSRRPAQSGVKDGYPFPSKKWLFYRFSVETVADGRRHIAYQNKHWLRAFER